VSQYRGDDGRPRTSAEQPYIYRLTRLGVVAAEQGHGIEFADEISRLIWQGTAHWDQGDHLALATQRAGLSIADMDVQIEKEVDRIEAVIDKNQQDHEAAGHWGVPTCAFRGEPFFGQDRLDVLLWRLQQEGLQAR
jgi:2-hydroxychromene-2-carboxylate isomerase